MQEQFTEVVEAATGRKVIAFMSQVHFDPDISLEALVLESQDGQTPADQNELEQPLPR